MNTRTVFFSALVLSLAATATVALAEDKDLLEYGDTLEGSISVTGEVDVHTFNCQAGDIVLIRLAEMTSSLEPRVVVTGPPGQTYSHSSSTLAEILTDPLNQNFTCTVSVSDEGNDDTGGYALHIQRINNPAGASSLNYGDTANGSVAQDAQTKAYTLDASGGDQVLFRLAEDAATTAIYPRIRVYSSDGTVVATTYGGSTAELNTVEIPASSTYTVLVMDYYGTGVGDFWLHCQCTNDPAGATAISYNQTLSGDWAHRAETDAYTFSGADSDLLLARLAESGSTTEPHLRLYGPDGVLIDGHSASNMAELPVTDLPGSDTYTLLAMDNPGTDTGGYALHIQRINNPAGASSLNYGDTANGSVAQDAQTKAYTLDASGGDQVLFRLAEDAATTAIYPRIRVYSSDGTVVATTYGGSTAELNTVEIPASSTYTVLVMDYYGTGVGDFWLHCQCTNDPAGATAISYNQTLSGDWAHRAETDAYTFSGADSDLLLARLAESGSTTEPHLRLYGPDGVLIDGHSASNMAELPVTDLPGSDTYTLLAMDNPGTDTGGYALHIQRINNPAGASSLNYGDTANGSVAQDAQTKAYTLDASGGDQVLFRLAEDAATTAIYPRIRVYSSDGTVVATTYGGSTAELNTVEIPASSTYTVLVMDYYGTGVGDFWLHCQCTNDPAGATAISYNQTLSGDWAHRAETDAYTFSGADSDLLLARLAESGSTTEPHLRLYGPDGVLIDGHSASNMAELPVTDLPGSDTYTLLAMDNPGTDTGGYALHIQRINNPAGASSLNYGDTANGSVAQDAQTKAYTLDASGGDQVLFRLAEDAATTAIYPRIRVYSSDGTVVATTYGGSTAELNTVEIPASSTYTVLVMDYYGTGVGDFWLHCQCTNDPAGATAISYNQTLSGDWAHRAETDAYTFSGADSDLLLARLAESGSTTEPHLRLYGPDGVLIDGHSASNMAELPVTDLPGSDTYTLLAMDNPGTDTGGYALHIQRINNPAGASSLNYGDTANGSVAQDAQTKAYTLDASGGDQVLFRLAEDAATTAIYPRIRVYSSDGTVVATTYGGSTAELNTVEIPASSTYTVLVMDYYGTGVGDFWLHCQCTNDPVGATALGYGDTHSDEWQLRSETDAYTFTGGANDTLVITLTEHSSTTEPLVRLYGPEGVQIAGHSSSTVAVISDLHLPTAGIYTILAMDNPGTDTGPYSLNLIGGGSIISVPEDDVPVAQTALHGCQPNPFNPATEIHFDLMRSAAVHLSIYSLDGRRLKTLADEVMPVGRHAVAWRGNDENGRRVASGTYLVQLLVDGKAMVKRATLLK